MSAQGDAALLGCYVQYVECETGLGMPGRSADVDQRYTRLHQLEDTICSMLARSGGRVDTGEMRFFLEEATIGSTRFRWFKAVRYVEKGAPCCNPFPAYNWHREPIQIDRRKA